MGVYNNDTNMGWLRSPIIDWLGVDKWEVRSTPAIPKDNIRELAAAWQGNLPTFGWVKDAEVHELTIPGLSWDAFASRLGLALDVSRGYEMAAKRWSRVFRPVGFAAWFEPRIAVLDVDPAMFDGRAFANRALLGKLSAFVVPGVNHEHRVRAMLERTHLGEITVQNAEGQIKGLAEFRWLPDDVDLMVPAKCVMTEVKMDFAGKSLVTVVPSHNTPEGDLDLQTIVNLLEPFGPLSVDQLNRWLEIDAVERLNAIGNGDAMRALAQCDVDDLFDHIARLATGQAGMWPLKRVVIGGQGDVEFPRLRRQLGDMWLAELVRDRKFHSPNLSGGRYYLTPDWEPVSGRATLERGQAMLDRKRGLLVHPADLLELDGGPGIFARTGGADLDDAYNCIVYTDTASGKLRLLGVRSPNGPGEYIDLEYVGKVEPAWHVPEMDSRKLPHPAKDYGNFRHVSAIPLRIDGESMRVARQDQHIPDGVLQAALRRPGPILGSMANFLMLFTGATGAAPNWLPMPISDVSDWSHGKFAPSIAPGMPNHGATRRTR